MQIIVISPEGRDPREADALGGMLELGLERYHVRKPDWAPSEIESWIARLPAAWRRRLILHGHPGLARDLGLLGCHHGDRDRGDPKGAFSSACHDLENLSERLGSFPQVIFGPVFPSLSKPGYEPPAGFPWERLRGLLSLPRSGLALAIGGVTAARLGRCRELGFDGVAVIGAVWGCKDPVGAFRELRGAAAILPGGLHAA